MIKRIDFHFILWIFLILYVVFSILIYIIEPGFTKIGDAFWYMAVGATSIGFGDYVVVTGIGRAMTIFLALYEAFLVAMFSGIVVSFYLEVVHFKLKNTATMFLEKLEHVSELSHEELVEIEEKIKELK